MNYRFCTEHFYTETVTPALAWIGNLALQEAGRGLAATGKNVACMEVRLALEKVD